MATTTEAKHVVKAAIVNTGGGCEAIEVTLPDGRTLLITAAEDPSLPEAGEAFSIGLYGTDGGEIALRDFPGKPTRFDNG